jgi:hypothetical protein
MRKSHFEIKRGSADGALDAAELLLEVLVWVMAWLVCPLWLSSGGADATTFLLYACASGLMLAAGTLLDSEAKWPGIAFVGWFTTVCVMSVIAVGGLFFVAGKLVT